MPISQTTKIPLGIVHESNQIQKGEKNDENENDSLDI